MRLQALSKRDAIWLNTGEIPISLFANSLFWEWQTLLEARGFLLCQIFWEEIHVQRGGSEEWEVNIIRNYSCTTTLVLRPFIWFIISTLLSRRSNDHCSPPRMIHCPRIYISIYTSKSIHDSIINQYVTLQFIPSTCKRTLINNTNAFHKQSARWVCTIKELISTCIIHKRL